MIISISALLGTLILPIFKSTILDVKSGITWFTDGVVNFLSVGLTLVFALLQLPLITKDAKIKENKFNE